MEELLTVPGIGPKVAESVITFFAQETNRQIIEKLRAGGVKLESESVGPVQGKLAGQEFVITGKLDSMTRTEAEAKVRELGGAAGSSVTRKTTHLVAGADPGSKLDKAQALGITILSEAEFLQMIEPKGYSSTSDEDTRKLKCGGSDGEETGPRGTLVHLPEK